MANTLYPKYKEALLAGTAGTSLLAGIVKVALIDTNAYTYDAGHEFMVDLAGVVGEPQEIDAPKTVTNGVFYGPGVTFPAVSGSPLEAMAIFIDSGQPETSRLVAYLDSDVAGLPITPDGRDIDVIWNISGIFAL